MYYYYLVPPLCRSGGFGQSARRMGGEPNSGLTTLFVVLVGVAIIDYALLFVVICCYVFILLYGLTAF